MVAVPFAPLPFATCCPCLERSRDRPKID
jgi:hypothetical protein